MYYMSNISRLTQRFHSFEGYKISIQRNHLKFVRHVSILEMGSEAAALREAVRIRDAVLNDLEKFPDKPELIFAKHRKVRPDASYPAGLHDISISGTDKHACTISSRATEGMNQALEQMSTLLGLNISSLLRLGIYALPQLLKDINPHDGNTLNEIVTRLEKDRPEGFPSWEEYTRKKKNN